jgi:outer membrane protein insertion porin family
LHKYLKILFISLLFITVQVTVIFAQDNGSQSDTTNEVVRRLRFVGNKFVNNSTLETIVRTHTNRQLFGIPGVTPWYWIWQLTKKFGERPAFLDRSEVGQDIERLKTYYNSQGYFNTSVDTTIVELHKNKYEVSFIINEGKPSYIRKILYTGMPHYDDPQKIQNFYHNSPLTKKQINDTTFQAKKRFTYDDIGNERDRIINFLKNNGYASVQKDSITVQIKKETKDTLNLDVLFLIKHGRLYHFGDTYINLSGPDNNISYNQFDTLKGKPYTADTARIIMQKEKGAHSRFSLLTSQLLFKPGDIFDNQRYMSTINQYQNLGMMNVRRFSLNKSGGLPDYSKKTIPVLIDLQTIPRRSITLDPFIMQRYGYGAGTGLTFTDNNAFGKAEKLDIGTKASFEYVSKKQSQSNILYNLQGSIGYTEPRLNFPFAFLDKNLNFLNSKTNYQVSISHANQNNFNINANIRFNEKFIVKHDQYTTSYLDLFDMEWIDASATPSFRAQLDSTFKGNELQKQFILEDFRPKLNTNLRYTYRKSTTDYIERDKGYYFEGSFEVGGNIPYFVDRYLTSPGTVEGSVPSFSFSKSRLTYSRYAKMILDYRRYIPVSPSAVFAYQGYFGFAYPYGKTRTIPLTKRFYAGGSNDIRGWAPYRLGPGPLEDQQVINGGEIKMAGHIELRQVLLKNFLSTRWIGAAFDDFGNVWNGPRNPISTGRFAFDSFYKQIAMSAGFGIRLDWQYVIFRIDLAYRVHDLKKGWFKKNVMGLSFGIGQSF